MKSYFYQKVTRAVREEEAEEVKLERQREWRCQVINSFKIRWFLTSGSLASKTKGTWPH